MTIGVVLVMLLMFVVECALCSTQFPSSHSMYVMRLDVCPRYTRESSTRRTFPIPAEKQPYYASTYYTISNSIVYARVHTYI